MWIFILWYVFIVWFFLPFSLIDTPPASFMATWIASQIAIIYVLKKLKRHRETTKGGQGLMGYVVLYLITSSVMLGVSYEVPCIIGDIKEAGVQRIIEEAQTEFKERIEDELPEPVKNANSFISKVSVSVVQSVTSKEEKADYYGNLIEVEVSSVHYLQPSEIAKIYDVVYEARKSIISSSCPNRERYQEAVGKYRRDRYAELSEIHDGISLKVECPNHLYRAESNEDLDSTSPSYKLTEITDEFTSSAWYPVYENEIMYGGSYVKKLWVTWEQYKKLKADKERKEQEEKEQNKKSQSKTGSSASSRNSGKSGSIDMDGGLDSYDAGYEDVYINDEFDEYRYEHDYDYALGVDDAMEDVGEWY